jgi:hypothetical protein
MRRTDDLMLTAEELRLRNRKRRIWFLLVLLLLLVIVGIFFGGRPASHAIKAWQARRHAAKAFVFLEEQKWNDARAEATAAYQLRPNEPQALRAVARYLSRTGQHQALEFWKSLRDVTPLTREDLRDEAKIALISGETERATMPISELLANDGREAIPEDWLLAAQLELQKHELGNAQRNIRKVFDHRNATERENLQAALIELQASRAGNIETDKQHQTEAWSRIKRLATDKTETALDALILLAQRTLSNQKSKVRSRKSEVGDQNAESDLAHALENHPLAKAPHKLLALDLQTHADPSQRDALIARAIRDWKDADETSLAALATWLNGKGEYQRELDTIPLEKALQSRELFLQHVDALGALRRWEEIKGLLEGERFPLDPVVQRMYLARCSAQLGEKAAAENNWKRALEAAHGDARKLLTLGDYAEKNGASEIAGAAYDSAATTLPKLRAAWQGRLRLAQARRETKKIHAVLAGMLKLWPNDSAIQNDEAYTRLLLLDNNRNDEAPAFAELRRGGPMTNDEELIAIEKLAEVLVKRAPSSLPHRTLLALARLKQGRPVAALDVYANIQLAPNALSPSALAVHAAVLASNDQRDDARREIEQVPLDKLLPEEQAGTADLRKEALKSGNAEN